MSVLLSVVSESCRLHFCRKIIETNNKSDKNWSIFLTKTTNNRWISKITACFVVTCNRLHSLFTFPSTRFFAYFFPLIEWRFHWCFIGQLAWKAYNAKQGGDGHESDWQVLFRRLKSVHWIWERSLRRTRNIT